MSVPGDLVSFDVQEPLGEVWVKTFETLGSDLAGGKKKPQTKKNCHSIFGDPNRKGKI